MMLSEITYWTAYWLTRFIAMGETLIYLASPLWWTRDFMLASLYAVMMKPACKVSILQL